MGANPGLATHVRMPKMRNSRALNRQADRQTDRAAGTVRRGDSRMSDAFKPDTHALTEKSRRGRKSGMTSEGSQVFGLDSTKLAGSHMAKLRHEEKGREGERSSEKSSSPDQER